MIIAADLANGVTPHQVCRLFIESDIDAADGAGLFKPELLLRPATAELTRRAAKLAGLIAASLFHYARNRQSVLSWFEWLKQVLPAGISRIASGMASDERSHPDVDILLIQPDQDGAELFFTNIFSYANWPACANKGIRARA